MKIVFEEGTGWTVAEKIAAIEETLADSLDAEKDFRRLGLTTFAHDAAICAVTCREQLLKLRNQ